MQTDIPLLSLHSARWCDLRTSSSFVLLLAMLVGCGSDEGTSSDGSGGSTSVVGGTGGQSAYGGLTGGSSTGGAGMLTGGQASGGGQPTGGSGTQPASGGSSSGGTVATGGAFTGGSSTGGTGSQTGGQSSVDGGSGGQTAGGTGAQGDGGSPSGGTGGEPMGGATTGGALAGGSGGEQGGLGGDTSGGTGGGSAGAGTGGDNTGGGGQTCPLPSSFRWTSTGPLAEPKNPGAKSLKDFSVTKYNGNYLVYATTADGDWNGFVSTFASFDQWANADQRYIPGLVAPTIFYFTPKDTWVLAYQWGFKYATSSTPDDPNSWTSTQPLLSGDPTGGRGTGPIDQTIICDDSDCYLFFNDDAGGVYRGSMPIGQFPGAFSNVTRIMDQPTSVIFEGVQVYSVKGSSKYLMIIENNGTRFFRAWTADSLNGDWTPLDGASSEQQPFAGRNNVTWPPSGQWTNDISHGDLVRENPSEKMEIDPCNLQMVYQGRDPNQNPPYIELPYRPGLLTLDRQP